MKSVQLFGIYIKKKVAHLQKYQISQDHITLLFIIVM